MFPKSSRVNFYLTHTEYWQYLQFNAFITKIKDVKKEKKLLKVLVALFTEALGKLMSVAVNQMSRNDQI